MAGRLIADALWTSRKLASLPTEAKPEYAWLYPIAAYNGVFELDIRAIHVKAYAYTRPEVTPNDVERFITAFRDANLLFVWKENGKEWAWWVGSDKPGRMPSSSLAKRYAERGTLPPDPPKEQLAQFLGSPTASGILAGGKDEVCHQQTERLSAVTPRTELNRTELNRTRDSDDSQLDGFEAFDKACSLYPKPEWDQPTQVAYIEAVEHICKKRSLERTAAVEWLNGRIKLYRSRVGDTYAVGFQKFLQKRMFDQPESGWGTSEQSTGAETDVELVPLSQRVREQREREGTE